MYDYRLNQTPLSPVAITYYRSPLLSVVYFFHILLFLLMHSLNVVYFLYASSDCTMKPVHQNYSHISSLYLLHTFCMLLLVVVRKMYINIDHIFPVCICCILFVHILLLVYTKRIHQNKSHFLCVFSMYASSIHQVKWSRFVYTFCVQIVQKSPPYFCKGLYAKNSFCHPVVFVFTEN